MLPDFVKFWRQFVPSQAPFIHPKDHDVLSRSKCLPDGDEPTDHESYVGSIRFGEPNDKRFHLSLLPVPYVGDVANADIVILLLNPGFHHSEYWAETAVPGFGDRLIRNLRQEFSAGESPFFCLDPQFCWYSRFHWWEKKLRRVISTIAEQKFKGSYRDAMGDLSRRLACIELVPYHSSSFGNHKLIADLPSARLAREFVSKHLLGSSGEPGKTVIVTRQVKGWSLHGSKDVANLVVYEGGHTLGASLGPGSLGGKAILRQYGIQPQGGDRPASD